MLLPRFLLHAAIFLVALAGCGAEVPGPIGTAGSLEAFKVVAGGGAVSPGVIAQVQEVAGVELVRVHQLLPTPAVRPFTIFVHEARDVLPAVLAGHLHPDSPGFALLGRHEIHLVWGEMRRTGASVRGVVAHELTHELLDQLVAPHGRQLPRWFHEGLAQLVAGDTYLGAREEDLFWRVSAGRLPSFGSLRDTFPSDSDGLRVAYAQSYSYVSWLVDQYGLDALLAVARAADGRTSFERALVGRTGRSTLELFEAWSDHLLYRSGASWRVVLDQCFGLLLIAALPVLALALIRRLRADHRARLRLAELEAAAAASAPEASPGAGEPPVADAAQPGGSR